jgi:serine/threonine-protein kinase HipA
MSQASRKIEVYAHWVPLTTPVLMGRLFVDSGAGRELFSFEFDAAFLETGVVHVLDPKLMLTRGRQFPGSDARFGMFMDSAPDRWGRLLMERRLSQRVKRGEVPKGTKLHELDYLLGVQDLARMGGLRLRENGGEFLAEPSPDGVPPITKLRELEAMAREFEAEQPSEEDLESASFSLLVVAGLSLGGARPKANVVDPDGGYWIAKFPKNSDRLNVGAWEMVCHDLARSCGLRVPTADLQVLSADGQSTFLSKRFDRAGRERIHFSSAMTQLGKRDGYSQKDGGSYLEMVDWIRTNCCHVEANLEEMWKRIVFSVCCSNTDDHLRNHGFILSPAGWVLAPAYDINPNPQGVGLALNIDDSSADLDLGLCMDVASVFGIDEQAARETIDDMSGKIASSWRSTARRRGIHAREMDLMEPAFAVAEKHVGGVVQVFAGGLPSLPTERGLARTPVSSTAPNQKTCRVAGCERSLKFSSSTPAKRIQECLCSQHFRELFPGEYDR